MAKWLIVLCMLCCNTALAQQTDDTTEQISTEKPTESGFEILQDLPTKNQIPLFDNRFRIDENVEEISLLLFRKRGSASVVLVKPDGSKIYFNTAEAQQVRWHDAANFDLIEIKNPMPGPWQAIGRLLPESRILVLTDIKLTVDPLPGNLMVGETVKVTARLTNGDEPINAKDFREVLALEVIFVSTNNSEYDNFGRGIIQVAQFRDDGKGYDERARDGVFTGEFQLRFASGEWTPKYIVRTPLYTREVEQENILLKPAPINADITVSPAIDETKPDQVAIPHQVLFNVTDDTVNKSTLLLQGRVRYPNGEVEEFALNEPGLTPRALELKNYGHGSYIMDVSAYGATQDGREFMLNLPEISFLVNRPVQEAPVLEELPQNIKDAIAAEQAAAEPEPEFPWLLVIMANVVILLGGGVAIWFVMYDKSVADLMFWRKAPADSQTSAPKTTQQKPEAHQAPASVQKNNDMDDILDLTLPDD